MNSINGNHAKNMQNPKLGDASFAMSTTCCNDRDWDDNFSYDLENLFNPHDDYDICNNIESGFGEVMTLVDDNPTIFEERQLCMHVDHENNILCDSYIVEFDYDPTCNCYERGKYCGRNFDVTKLPLVLLRLLLSLSSSLHLVTIGCLANLFPIKCLCIGSMLDLDMFVTYFMMLSSCPIAIFYVSIIELSMPS
ncbi:hypothetical protein D1007_29734 [Hordeum vulgare]|nr:hypothetical protein D1007_29734 [Hordeum vulgare]